MAAVAQQDENVASTHGQLGAKKGSSRACVGLVERPANQADAAVPSNPKKRAVVRRPVTRSLSRRACVAAPAELQHGADAKRSRVDIEGSEILQPAPEEGEDEPQAKGDVSGELPEFDRPDSEHSDGADDDDQCSLSEADLEGLEEEEEEEEEGEEGVEAERPNNHPAESFVGGRPNIQFEPELAHDIVRVWLARQESRHPSCTYMQAHTDINANMRSVVAAWLVEVHQKLHLEQETLHLAINLFDRFLERRLVSQAKLQLVGVASLFLASKFQEVFPPDVEYLEFVCNNLVTRRDIVRMEEYILVALSFRLCAPSSLAFAQRWVTVAGHGLGEGLDYAVQYLLELSLVHFPMLRYLPSIVATAATVLCLRVMSAPDATISKVLEESGHSEEELVACLEDMEDLCGYARASSRLRVVHSKFSGPSFDGVATSWFAQMEYHDLEDDE